MAWNSVQGHSLLPRNRPGWTVVVVLEVEPLHLGCSGGLVASKPLLHVVHGCIVSPASRDDVVVVILSVEKIVLVTWSQYPQQVMDADASHDDGLHGLGVLHHGTQEASEAVRYNTKGILHTASGTGHPVVEDALFIIQWLRRKWLDHVQSQRKGVVCHDEIRHVPVVAWQCIWLWEVDRVVNEVLAQRALQPELRVGAGPRGSQLHPPELVVTIDKGKNHDGVVPLVVVVGAASIGWSLDADVLPIEGTKGMVEVPSAGVDIINLLPSVCCGRVFYQLRVLITYGLARLLHQHGDGVVGHVEEIHERTVVVSCSHVAESDRQLDTN